jgi:hypothetical protein
VSPFGPVEVDSHDWTVMQMMYGMLSRDHAIGAGIRRAGLIGLVGAMGGGGWVLRVMGV